MILSISRRTDIPAFYTPWLLHRVAQGFVCVRNPHIPAQIKQISLQPGAVDGIVLWSKNPAPLLPRLSALQNLACPCYLQFTLTPYGKDIEPKLPKKEELLNVLLSYSRVLGSHGVIWRYDPIILNTYWTIARHLHAFAQMCQRLEGAVDTCVISFVDRYGKNAPAYQSGLLRPITPGEMQELAAGMAAVGAAHGITLQACCEALDLSTYGITSAHCIDAHRLEALAGYAIKASYTGGQRPLCGCAQSIDIGAYDTCPHGCLYCYANQSETMAMQNYAHHQVNSPLLLGSLAPSERTQKTKQPPKEGRQLSFLHTD